MAPVEGSGFRPACISLVAIFNSQILKNENHLCLGEKIANVQEEILKLDRQCDLYVIPIDVHGCTGIHIIKNDGHSFC